jgi:hypothetical protein
MNKYKNCVTCDFVIWDVPVFWAQVTRGESNEKMEVELEGQEMKQL